MALLGEKKCLPCQGGVPPLESAECHKLCRQLNARWHLNRNADRLFCSLGMEEHPPNIFFLFRELGELSERENHHPELRWRSGRLDVEIWTHKIDALVESDFILAAKMDNILDKSGIATLSFAHPCEKGASEVFSETYRGWGVIPGKNNFFRRFSFENFRSPWEWALKLLDPAGSLHGHDLGIELGYGHLGVRVGGPRGRDTVDKIHHLMTASSH